MCLFFGHPGALPCLKNNIYGFFEGIVVNVAHSNKVNYETLINRLVICKHDRQLFVLILSQGLKLQSYSIRN